MLVKFINSIVNKLAVRIAGFIKIPPRKSNESLMLAQGAFLSKQQWLLNSNNINDHEFKIFSQFGDDGIIQYLIKHVKIENKLFVEFGVQNYLESNTHFLLKNNNWSGFVMDGSEDYMKGLMNRNWYWKYDLNCKAVFITKENINELLSDPQFNSIGLYHIDIDGNDYHILMESDFSKLNPSILIVEYNSVFGPDRPITVPYDKDFVRSNKHYSNLYYGASLKALEHGASQKGYSLIGCNLGGNNAYFVRNDLLNDKVKAVGVKTAFVESKFREARNTDGSLMLLGGKDRLDLIKGNEVLNVVTNEIEKL